MPSRILRDTYATSESVASMDPGAQDRLPRYCLLADDFGVFPLNEAVICGRIFPLRPDMNPQRVAADLREFERAGVLVAWTAEDGKRYAEFPNWFKHQRAPRPGTKRKYPERMPDHSLSGAKIRSVPQEPAAESGGPQETAETGNNPRPQSQAQASSAVAVAVESAGAVGNDAPAPCEAPNPSENMLRRLGALDEVHRAKHPLTAALMDRLGFQAAWAKDATTRSAIEALLAPQDLDAVARRVEASFAENKKPWLGWHTSAIQGRAPPGDAPQFGRAPPRPPEAFPERTGEVDLHAV